MVKKIKVPNEQVIFTVTLVKTEPIQGKPEMQLRIDGDNAIMSDPIRFIGLMKDMSGIMKDHFIKQMVDKQSSIIKPQVIVKPDLKVQ